MTEEVTSEKKGNIDSTINAVTGLVKEIPVYGDAIQPIAKETGKALQTVGRTVNAALMPLRSLVWGIEKIEEFVTTRVTKKLEHTPVEDICTPDPSVAGPALESLKYTGHKETLSELYANLIVSAMDKKTAKNAHPGFVEIIKNLSSDEAKVLEYIIKMQVAPIVDIERIIIKQGGSIAVSELVSTIGFDARCEHKDLIGSYLINLERLGLVEIPKESSLTKPGVYDRIENDPPVKAIIQQQNDINKDEYKGQLKKYYFRSTVFGKQFNRTKNSGLFASLHFSPQFLAR